MTEVAILKKDDTISCETIVDCFINSYNHSEVPGTHTVATSADAGRIKSRSGIMTTRIILLKCLDIAYWSETLTRL